MAFPENSAFQRMDSCHRPARMKPLFVGKGNLFLAYENINSCDPILPMSVHRRSREGELDLSAFSPTGRGGFHVPERFAKLVVGRAKVKKAIRPRN